MHMAHETNTNRAWTVQAVAKSARTDARSFVSAAARALWRWLDVRTDDPVQQTRLRGLLLIVPPMLLSHCARSVVGICMKLMPRR